MVHPGARPNEGFRRQLCEWQYDRKNIQYLTQRRRAFSAGFSNTSKSGI